jgi:hypothetical protein
MFVAVVCALATATCTGYYLGRRTGSRPSTWKKRTSRIALGKQAMSLLVLMTARRVGQRLGRQRALRGLGSTSGVRTIGPVEFLRAGVAWMRS